MPDGYAFNAEEGAQEMTRLHHYTCKRCGASSKSADGHHHKEAIINSKHSKCSSCGAFAWDLKCPVDCEDGGLLPRLMRRLGWIRLETPEVKGIAQ